MKRIWYCLCIAALCTQCAPMPKSLTALPPPKLLPGEKIERFWYSEEQDSAMLLKAIRSSTVYIRWYINDVPYTEIADTPSSEHATLIAELPLSQVVRVGKIGFYKSKAAYVKGL